MSTIHDPTVSLAAGFAQPADLDLVNLNARFEQTPAEKVVDWSIEHFGRELVMSSSFGAESAVMIHLVTRAMPDIRVIFVNTGYLFPETHRFMEELRLRFNLNVWTYRTRNDPIRYLQAVGENDPTWRTDTDRCCAANKTEPFERALRDLKPRAWLRGIRRSQNAERVVRPFVEWSKRDGCYAVSPLLNWSQKMVHEYLKQHDLPYHPLVEKGYFSIGCNPLSCTRAITAGDDPRAGRWAGTDKTECGINVTNNSLDSANL